MYYGMFASPHERVAAAEEAVKKLESGIRLQDLPERELLAMHLCDLEKYGKRDLTQ